MIADLHCHSTASDGELPPGALYHMAVAAGIELFALTDHDTVDGVAQLMAQAPAASCRLVSGVEISTVWHKRGVHVVGLDMDIRCAALTEALAGQRDVRYQRARHIGERLAQQGISGACEGALALSGDAAPCRPHFAAWLVEQGISKDTRQAFSRYLGNKKLPELNRGWPGPAEAVQWIVAAGGVAVLAHPEDYRLSRGKLRALLREFIAAGGSAVELAAPTRPDAGAQLVESLARELGLAVSVGSDYHNAGQGWRRLGRTRPIPADLTPVWELFQ